MPKRYVIVKRDAPPTNIKMFYDEHELYDAISTYRAAKQAQRPDDRSMLVLVEIDDDTGETKDLNVRDMSDAEVIDIEHKAPGSGRG